MTYPYPHGKYGMPAECFDEMMDMQFEGYCFRVFKEYDNYLRELYGDYRKLPPKEERKAHLSVSKIQLLEPEDIFSKEELTIISLPLFLITLFSMLVNFELLMVKFAFSAL